VSSGTRRFPRFYHRMKPKKGRLKFSEVGDLETTSKAGSTAGALGPDQRQRVGGAGLRFGGFWSDPVSARITFHES